jgi:hypothetical protein
MQRNCGLVFEGFKCICFLFCRISKVERNMIKFIYCQWKLFISSLVLNGARSDLYKLLFSEEQDTRSQRFGFNASHRIKCSNICNFPYLFLSCTKRLSDPSPYVMYSHTLIDCSPLKTVGTQLSSVGIAQS